VKQIDRRLKWLWFLLLAAIGTFGYLAYRMYPQRPEPNIWAMFFGLFFFVLIERLASIFLYAADIDRDRELDDVVAAIYSHGDLHDIGLPPDALRWVADALEGKNGQAVFVRDLMVRANKNASYSAERDMYGDYLSSLVKFINNGYRYVLVGNKNGMLTTGDYEDRRYPQYKTLLAASNYIERITTDPIHFPIVNFAIVEYEPGTKPKEVLFGWDFDTPEACHIFHTTRPKVVNYFELLFAACVGCSSDWNASVEPDATMDEDKQTGKTATISIAKTEEVA
jgi:hypothetical protein